MMAVLKLQTITTMVQRQRALSQQALAHSQQASTQLLLGLGPWREGFNPWSWGLTL